MNMLGSLLKNHEVNLTYDAMQCIIQKTSFTNIRRQKHKIEKK
jgi:hypothetical protein